MHGAATPPGGDAARGPVTDRYPVSAPVPPDDTDAWYAPTVRDQREVHPGVVVTVRDNTGDGGARFRYETREPGLGPDDRAALERVREHFSTATERRRPLTREGTVERAEAGFSEKYSRVLDRLLNCSAAARRRIEYHALAELRLLGDLTPVAIDGRVEVADVGGPEDLIGGGGDREVGGPLDGRAAGDADRTGTPPRSPGGVGDGTAGQTPEAAGQAGSDRRPLVVHMDEFSPAVTAFDVDAEFVERVAGERLRRYSVEFAGFAIDVVVYREHLLGRDRFTVKYAVLEPDLLPGDEELVRECKERIWETNAGAVLGDGPDDRAGATGGEVLSNRRSFVRDRARQFLSRRLTARNAQAWIESARYRVRSALAEYGLAVPPVDSRYAEDRLDDLVYYVMRDYVGDGILTVPIRDPHLEDVEANRVGERVKVVPRDEIAPVGRVPTNLTFDTETDFVNVVTQLAASDGVELNASRPTAKVNLDPPGVEATVRCAVALPAVSEDGPHVSIRKQRADALTPVDLVERDALPTELVTLLWLCYEHRAVVLFSGPTGVGKTTLMNAHMPFIPFDDRPVSIDEGSREVRIPHETGVSLTTRDHESEYKRVSMADLMTEANYLNPDIEVIAEVNTPASFETFGELINTGHGVVGTTHSEDVETLVNRVIEQGLPAYLLREIDLVVFPRHVDGERYVGEVIEFVDADAYDDLSGRKGTIEKDSRTMYWNAVIDRDPDGDFSFAYRHRELGDEVRTLDHRLFHRIARATDRDVEAVETEFLRKHNYVRYLVKEGITDFDQLFGFLADLRTNESATVEKVHRELTSERAGRDDAAAGAGVGDPASGPRTSRENVTVFEWGESGAETSGERGPNSVD